MVNLVNDKRTIQFDLVSGEDQLVLLLLVFGSTNVSKSANLLVYMLLHSPALKILKCILIYLFHPFLFYYTICTIK